MTTFRRFQMFCAGWLLAAWLGGGFAAAQTTTLAAAMQPFVDQHDMAGAGLLVATKDKVLDVETVGYANVETKKPMTADTFFWIASMTKAMTCSAMLMLVDEGKVSLDDPVEKYLPEFTGQQVIVDKAAVPPVLKTPAHPMTIRNLMSHTAGLPEKTPADSPTFDMTPLSVRIPNYAATPLESEPGTKFHYTNVGMTTVGRIVEVVSGMPYEEFMQKRLFGPLGMTDTTFHPSAAQLQRLATTYKINATKDGIEPTGIGMLNKDLTDPKRVAWPGGGLFSTAADVGKFCQMFLNGGVSASGQRILSQSSVDLATKKETGPAVKDGYGFGWMMFPGGYFHAGADHTEMRVYPKDNLITVFMTQQASDFAGTAQKDFRPALEKAAKQVAAAAAAAAH